MSKIELRNVYKIFGGGADEALEQLQQGASREEAQRATGAVPAVIDATLAVEQGEIFVVMGLSGSGKSTLLRTVNRLFEPTSGRVLIDGDDITDLGPKELRAVRGRKVSMVFQHFALFPHRTVLENAAFGLRSAGVADDERRERARRALSQVGLEGWEDSFPQQLSGGMQQRVGLARALATDAEILLMDEAFSALDPLIRREMQDELLELQRRLGNTIVFITHDLNEAMRIGDRIAMMKDGRIVQIGTAEDILQDPANDYVASFVQDVDRSRVLTAAAVMRPPVASIGAAVGPRAAARAMNEHQTSALFVVGPDRRLLGTVRDDDVVRAVRQGERHLEPILQKEVATVEPDTPLVEMFTPAAESTLPLAVVDDGRLVGVVPRVALLAAVGGPSSDSAIGEDVEESSSVDGSPVAPEDVALEVGTGDPEVTTHDA